MIKMRRKSGGKAYGSVDGNNYLNSGCEFDSLR